MQATLPFGLADEFAALVGVMSLAPAARVKLRLDRVPLLARIEGVSRDEIVAAAMDVTPRAIGPESPWYLIRQGVAGVGKGRDLYATRITQMRELLTADLVADALDADRPTIEWQPTHARPNLRWQATHQSRPYAYQWDDPTGPKEVKRPKIHLGAQWLTAIGVGVLDDRSIPDLPIGWAGARINAALPTWSREATEHRLEFRWPAYDYGSLDYLIGMLRMSPDQYPSDVRGIGRAHVNVRGYVKELVSEGICIRSAA
jgi:hypothetical protein